MADVNKRRGIFLLPSNINLSGATAARRAKKIKIKIIALLSKTKTLHVDHAFLYIFLPSQHDCDAKMPKLTFYGRRIFFPPSSINLSAVPKKSTPENSPTFDTFSKLK